METVKFLNIGNNNMKTHKYICHKQEWSSHTNWFIMESHGYAMLRMTLYRTNPGTAWVSDLFVTENQREKGYASGLLDYAIAIANEEHFNMECMVSKQSKLLLRIKGFKELKNGNFAREFERK